MSRKAQLLVLLIAMAIWAVAYTVALLWIAGDAKWDAGGRFMALMVGIVITGFASVLTVNVIEWAFEETDETEDNEGK